MRYFELYVDNSYMACISCTTVTIRAKKYGYHFTFYDAYGGIIGFWHTSNPLKVSVKEYHRRELVDVWMDSHLAVEPTELPVKVEEPKVSA